jgi:hypothetical protein
MSETGLSRRDLISGDASCRSTNVDYRLDTRAARFFLES